MEVPQHGHYSKYVKGFIKLCYCFFDSVRSCWYLVCTRERLGTLETTVYGRMKIMIRAAITPVGGSEAPEVPVPRARDLTFDAGMP